MRTFFLDSQTHQYPDNEKKMPEIPTQRGVYSTSDKNTLPKPFFCYSSQGQPMREIQSSSLLSQRTGNSATKLNKRDQFLQRFGSNNTHYDTFEAMHTPPLLSTSTVHYFPSTSFHAAYCRSDEVLRKKKQETHERMDCWKLVAEN